MTDGIINIRFKESATEEDIQAAVSSFYKLFENMIDRMDYKECNEECQAFRWGECEGNGKRIGRRVNEVMPEAIELTNLGKSVAIRLLDTCEGKRLYDEISKIMTDLEIDIENDCEYDCGNQECLAPGCERYGKCIFTNAKGYQSESGEGLR